MMTPRELFLELLKPDGQPDRQLCQYEALHMCLNDPINTYLRGNRKRGTVSKDRWGTTISFPTDAPGPMPVTADGLAVCPDVTHWRDTVHAPDIDSCTEGWETCRTAARAACGQEKLLAGFMGTGIFEQCHFLMGFEDTLTNLYEHPDEMRQLIEYITEYRLRYVQLLIDRLQPDVIFSHDDWGTKDALFMHPDMWREFFKEPYRRFYGYIRSRGVIAIHHADSYLAPIVEDMAEIGIQVWQGVLPENDIPSLQRQLNGRLVLMGGMGAAIDRADAAPEEIYDYAMTTLRTCCPGGHYIPSITYGLPGAVYPHVDKHIDRAIADYNSRLHVPRFCLPPVPRRADTGHEPAGRGLLRQPRLCAGDAHGRPLHDDGTGGAEAADDRRGRADGGTRLHRHRPGRHARHRQESGEDHAGGQRRGGGGSGRGRDAGAVRGDGAAGELRHHRLLVPADHHHAGDAPGGGAGGGKGHPRPGEDLRGRRAHQPELLRRDRRGRVHRGRGGCRPRRGGSAEPCVGDGVFAAPFLLIRRGRRPRRPVSRLFRFVGADDSVRPV